MGLCRVTPGPPDKHIRSQPTVATPTGPDRARAQGGPDAGQDPGQHGGLEKRRKQKRPPVPPPQLFSSPVYVPPRLRINAFQLIRKTVHAAALQTPTLLHPPPLERSSFPPYECTLSVPIWSRHLPIPSAAPPCLPCMPSSGLPEGLTPNIDRVTVITRR